MKGTHILHQNLYHQYDSGWTPFDSTTKCKGRPHALLGTWAFLEKKNNSGITGRGCTNRSLWLTNVVAQAPFPRVQHKDPRFTVLPPAPISSYLSRHSPSIAPTADTISSSLSKKYSPQLPKLKFFLKRKKKRKKKGSFTRNLYKALLQTPKHLWKAWWEKEKKSQRQQKWSI